ncbi:MAG: hypothetical protein EBR30_04470 [Cytophagia bacterium]|nr:hypothetical protein [Cytophagia bacterium]NBW34269.1 hypothetical protein [Cytophagia bacterium]
MQEFFKDKSAHVYYDATLDTLFLVYTGKVQNDQQFITINTAVLAAFTKLNTQKFVADIRKMGIISVASQNWVIANLLPGMVKHLKGKMLYHAQVVDPSEILSKVSANNIKDRSKQVATGFEVVQFSDEEKLKEYLKSVD